MNRLLAFTFVFAASITAIALSAVAAQDTVTPADTDVRGTVDTIVKDLQSESVDTRNSAVERLATLEPAALPLLKERADEANRANDFETELRLRQAIERIENATALDGKDTEDVVKGSDGDDIILPGLRVHGGFGATFRSETIMNGKRVIVDEHKGVRTELTRDGEGPIHAKVSKNGETTESSFETPEQLKEKDPDLYAIWSGESSGIQVRIFGGARPAPKNDEKNPARGGDEIDPFGEIDRMQKEFDRLQKEQDQRMRDMLRRFRNPGQKKQEPDQEAPQQETPGEDEFGAPADEFDDMQREIDRVFERILRRHAGGLPAEDDQDESDSSNPAAPGPKPDDTEDRY